MHEKLLAVWIRIISSIYNRINLPHLIHTHLQYFDPLGVKSILSIWYCNITPIFTNYKLLVLQENKPNIF